MLKVNNRKFAKTVEALGNVAIFDCEISIHIDDLAKVPSRHYCDGTLDDVTVVFPVYCDCLKGDVTSDQRCPLADLYNRYFDFLYLRSDTYARADRGMAFLDAPYREFFPEFAKMYFGKKISRPVESGLKVYAFELAHLFAKEMCEVITRDGIWDCISYDEFSSEFQTSGLEFIPDYIGYETDSDSEIVYAFAIEETENGFPIVKHKCVLHDIVDEYGAVVSLALI